MLLDSSLIGRSTPLSHGYRPRRLLILSLLPLLPVFSLACGSEVDTTPTTTSNNNEDPCAAFAEPPEASRYTVEITLRNNRANTIYVPTFCIGGINVQIDGKKQTGTIPPLTYTCEEARDKSAPCCDCFPESAPVPPGGTYVVKWEGRVFEETEMPKACYTNVEPYSCVQGKLVPQTTSLALVTSVFVAESCNGPGGELCGPDGSLVEFSTATFTPETTKSVEIVVE